MTASGGIIGTFNPDIVGVKNKVELFYDANNVYLCDHCKFSDFFGGQLPFFLGGDVSQIAGARTYWPWRCSRSGGRSL